MLGLLAVAAGTDPYRLITNSGPRVLEEAGWRLRNGEALSEHDAFELGRATVEVLSVLTQASGPRRQVPPAARDLARAALATPVG